LAAILKHAYNDKQDMLPIIGEKETRERERSPTKAVIEFKP